VNSVETSPHLFNPQALLGSATNSLECAVYSTGKRSLKPCSFGNIDIDAATETTTKNGPANAGPFPQDLRQRLAVQPSTKSGH